MNDNTCNDATDQPVYLNNKATQDVAVFSGTASTPTNIAAAGASVGAALGGGGGGLFIEIGKWRWGFWRRGAFQKRERETIMRIQPSFYLL